MLGDGFVRFSVVVVVAVATVELELDGDGTENECELIGPSGEEAFALTEKVTVDGQFITPGGGIFREVGGGNVISPGGGTLKEPGGKSTLDSGAEAGPEFVVIPV